MGQDSLSCIVIVPSKSVKNMNLGSVFIAGSVAIFCSPILSRFGNSRVEFFFWIGKMFNESGKFEDRGQKKVFGVAHC